MPIDILKEKKGLFTQDAAQKQAVLQYEYRQELMVSQ